MSNTINLTCNYCNTKFEKYIGEYNRQIKNGKKIFYCSRSCSGKGNAKNLGDHLGNSENLLRGYDRTDDYTPFRKYIRRVKKRHRETGKPYNIDVVYLKKIWDKQDGKCAITGVKLYTKEPIDNPNYAASLDRIDSSKGYIKGNIQFISVTTNQAKNKFPIEVLNEYFDIIKDL